jgi:uncharacterized membrane protein YfcA
MVLQITTAIGALGGAFVSVYAPENLLNMIFGFVLVYASVSMLAKRQSSYDTSKDLDLHNLGDDYFDPSAKQGLAEWPA